MGALLSEPIIPPDLWDQKWITQKQIWRRIAQQFGTPIQVPVQRLCVGQLNRNRLNIGGWDSSDWGGTPVHWMRLNKLWASTISFNQANLQNSIAASRILTRTVGIQGFDLALTQEPWYHGGCIRGLNIPGYTLFSVNGIDRPRACILMRNETAWMLPGFSCRDLVAVLIKYNEEGVERRLVVYSAYLPYDSEDPPPSKECEDLVLLWKGKPLSCCGVWLQCTS